MVLKPGPRGSRGRVAKVGDTAHVAPKWYAHLACGQTTAGGGVWEGLQRDHPGGMAPALVLPPAATRWRTPLGPEARTANLWGQSPPQACRPGSALCRLPGAWLSPAEEPFIVYPIRASSLPRTTARRALHILHLPSCSLHSEVLTCSILTLLRCWNSYNRG